MSEGVQDAQLHEAQQTSTNPEDNVPPRPTLQARPATDNETTNTQIGGTEQRLPGSAPNSFRRHVAFNADDADEAPSPLSKDRRRSTSFFRRMSHDKERGDADVYYDSRAATKREWRRRATTLQDYYKDNPDLLPQLPFTWHHGVRRFRLGAFIVLLWIDACVLPIALYYGLYYGAHVQGWIIFAVVTTIWGGPTYLEFGLRTIRLMKKERFYRPLGTNSRWCFDMTTWASVITITAVTSLFIVGSAPHIVWLRVLSMPAPALLYSTGGILSLLTLWNVCGWKAPFRISSTAKGEPVKPGVYYFVEDVVAVNANAGRPFREALAARYEASPRFRQMMYMQSIFWGVPPLFLAIPLTVIACIHEVPVSVAYAVCWAVPFIWATVWALISMWWVKRDMVRERKEWKAKQGPIVEEKSAEASDANDSALGPDDKVADEEAV